MAHPRARLNVFAHQLLVSRVDEQGWPVALAAESLGISEGPGDNGNVIATGVERTAPAPRP